MTHILEILILTGITLLLYSRNILSYINTQLVKMKVKKVSAAKIVVFDLDETLGYFTEISIFWDALEQFYGHNLFADKFFEMLDVFPEVFRPDMLRILDVLHKKRLRKNCYKLFIYTNNQGLKSWVTMISDYMSYKNGYKIFDQIIAAYKIRGKQIEPKRTSHEKSLADLISCTNIPTNTEVCFIDDLYHPLMDTENVYYINIKPYRISIPFEEIATRYYHAVLAKNNIQINQTTFVSHIVNFMRQYNYMILKKSEEEKNVDKIVSKKLLSNLEDFLKCDRNSTTRKKRYRRVKSIRNYNK
jgi:hypothetical protein